MAEYNYIAGRKTNSGAAIDGALAQSEATLQAYRNEYGMNNNSTRGTGNASAIISSIGNLVSGIGSAVGSVFEGIGKGRAIENGNYYNQYNQGVNNSMNSSGTAIFLVAAIAVTVLIVKK